MPSVGKVTEIEPGQMKAVDLQGTRVGLANVDGHFYAFSDVCPHDEDLLSSGSLNGLELTCRTDGSRFDLSSGNVLMGPATKRIRTYRVQVEGDDIRI